MAVAPFAERLACLRHAFEYKFKTSVSVESMLDTPNIVPPYQTLIPVVTDSI